MPFIKRINGVIVGCAASCQVGWGDEFLADDDPELMECRNPSIPTNDEIYDQVMQNQKVLKAFALCINDGSIVPGVNVSGAVLKAAVKSKM